MSVDPNIDYTSHDPEDREELSDDPRIRAAQEQEARLRRALATKDNPLRDGETLRDRLRRSDAEHGEAVDGEATPGGTTQG